MNKTLFVLTFLLFLYSNSNSQDLIITKNGDSINCSIVKKQYQFFIYKLNQNGIINKNAINESNVAKIEYDYYKNSARNTINTNSTSVSKWEIGVGYNYSVLPNYYKKVNIPVYDNYYKRLSTGKTIHFEINYWTFKRFGFKLCYDQFNSKSEEKQMPFIINGTQEYLFVQDELKIQSISPGICFKTPIQNEKNSLILNAAYEFNFYSNPIYIENANAEIRSNSSGINLAAIFERSLNNHFSIGLSARYRFSKLKDVDFVSSGSANNILLDEEDKLRINRYDLGVVICIK